MKFATLCALALCLALCSFAALADDIGTAPIDYAGGLTLRMASDTVKQEVTVKTYVDGDTTHFYVPTSVMPSGVLKARYLAINTPEITGKVEEYGKRAAAFTREKLSGAQSILIESDNGAWNRDSTAERYLVWVWYKPAGADAYRNLNVEILQNGLAIANSTANNRYGDTCMAALKQAKAMKLSIYSGQRDPDFHYGEAVELTLKELRCNLAQYEGVKVAFSGVITMNHDNSVFVEALDAESGLYFGIPVYYGYGLSGKGLDILKVGNEARIVGTLQYYEVGGTYQVSGVSYRMMQPNDPGNLRKLSDGHKPAYLLTDPALYASGKRTVENGDQSIELDYAALVMDTSIDMRNLTVESVHRGETAVTLTCRHGDATIVVRVYNMPIPEDITGKTIDVRGIAGCYDGAYQISVYLNGGITIHQ